MDTSSIFSAEHDLLLVLEYPLQSWASSSQRRSTVVVKIILNSSNISVSCSQQTRSWPVHHCPTFSIFTKRTEEFAGACRATCPCTYHLLISITDFNLSFFHKHCIFTAWRKALHKCFSAPA